MRNLPWRSVLLVVAGAFIATVILVPDPKPQDLSSLSASQLVELLDSRRQAVRQAAAGQLIARGKTVAPDLVVASVFASPDQLREIMAILNELLLSSDQQVAEAAETALEQAERSENKSAADMASRVLLKNTTLRHTRAMAQIVRLGGAVMMVAGNESVTDESTTREEDMPMAATRPRIASRVVVLDRNWQGGDAGLKHVRRIGYPGEPLSLHVADDAPVTEEALRRLRAEREKTLIRRPHHGCMGVIYSEDPTAPPVIIGVISDSPAERAGLRTGDWIVSVDGATVEGFAHVAGWARDHRPGETLELVVRRGVDAVPVSLTLGTDFGTGVCRCVE